MKHNKKYIDKLKLQNRIFWFIFFFLCVYALLKITEAPVISPCPKSGCARDVIYHKENLTIEEQMIISGMRMFGLNHLQPLKNLVFRESSLNPHAVNRSSGACGLFQAYPCSKMKCNLGDYECQINWGLQYIAKRYKNPSNAWAFWQQHGYY